MAGSVIGALRVNLALDSAEFSKGVKRVQSQQAAMKTQLLALGAVAASVAGGLSALAISTSETAAEIKRFAQIANAAPEEFQRWAAGAASVGISQEKLGDILKDVNDRVGDFVTTGAGPMVDFFEKIGPKVGVTADAFRNLSGPEALQLYVSSLEKAGASQQEMTFYLEAMASDTTALIPLLRDGGAEMARLGANAASLGGIMSGSTVASLGALKVSLADAGTALQGIGYRISGEVAPALTVAVTAFSDAMRAGGALRVVSDGLINNMDRLATYAATAAALMGGRYVGALVAANAANLSLTASTYLLRAALIRLPFVALAVGVGELVVRLTGMNDTNRIAAATIDGLTASAGQELDKIALLTGTLAEGTRMTRDMAVAKLSQASAHLANVDAMRVEAVETIKATEAYRQFEQVALDAQQRIAAIMQEQERNGGIYAPMAEQDKQAIEFYRTALAETVREQKRLVESAAPLSPEYVAASAAVVELERMIAAATGGMVTFHGAAADTSGVADNLNAAIAGINFSTAVAGAQALAAQLGVSLHKAMQMQGLLGAARQAAADAVVFDPRDPRYDAAAAATAARTERLTAIMADLSKEATKVSVTMYGAGAATAKANAALRDTGGSAGKAAQALERLKTQTEGFRAAMQDAALSAEDLGKAKAGILISGIDGIAQAAGKLATGGIRSFRDLANTGGDILTKFIADAVALFARQKLVLALGFGGAPTGALAGAANLAGGIGGAAGGLGGLAGVGSLASVALNGATASFGAFASGGLSAGIGQIGATLSGATASLSGLAAAAGAVALPLAAVYGAFKFFSVSSKELDAGIRLSIAGNELLAESYKKVQKSRFFGLSKSTSTTTGAIDDGGLADAYAQIYKGAEQAAWALGVSSKALAGYTAKVSLSTKGMDEAGAQQAALAALQDAQNGLAAKFFGGLGKGAISLIQPGEQAGAAMDRIRMAVQVASPLLDVLGSKIEVLGLSGARSAAAFTEALGGIQNAGNAVSAYMASFYTDAERATVMRKQLVAGLNDIGITSVPRSLEAYRAKIERALAAGQEGRAGKLISFAPAFAEWKGLRTDIMDAARAERQAIAATAAAAMQARQGERMGIQRQIWQLMGNENALRKDTLSGLDASNRTLQKRLYALQDEKAAQEDLEKSAVDAAAAIQKMIDAVDPAKFATSFAYSSALASAAQGLTPGRVTPTGVPIAAVPQIPQPQTLNSLATEIAALRKEVAAFRGEAVSLQTNANADIRKIRRNSDTDQIIGTPPVRTTA